LELLSGRKASNLGGNFGKLRHPDSHGRI
jgi:hypothetical protein